MTDQSKEQFKDQLPNVSRELTKQCQTLEKKMDLVLEKLKKRKQEKSTS